MASRKWVVPTRLPISQRVHENLFAVCITGPRKSAKHVPVLENLRAVVLRDVLHERHKSAKHPARGSQRKGRQRPQCWLHPKKPGPWLRPFWNKIGKKVEPKRLGSSLKPNAQYALPVACASVPL